MRTRRHKGWLLLPSGGAHLALGKRDLSFIRVPASLTLDPPWPGNFVLPPTLENVHLSKGGHGLVLYKGSLELSADTGDVLVAEHWAKGVLSHFKRGSEGLGLKKKRHCKKF
jgi:hypothetical protein